LPRCTKAPLTTATKVRFLNRVAQKFIQKERIDIILGGGGSAADHHPHHHGSDSIFVTTASPMN